MTNYYFNELMQGFGAKVQGRNAYGVYGGLAYGAQFITEGTSSQLIFSFILHGGTRIARAVLNPHRQKYISWYATPCEGECLLTAVFTPPSEFYVKVGVKDIFKSASKIAAEVGFSSPTTCPLCGQANCDAYALLNGSYRATHAACLTSRLNLPPNNTTTKATVKGRVLNGILGALLGAFIGALPIWALALSQGKLYWAMYVFIPILSGLCYRLCRGKANKNIAGVSVLLASLLFALALEQVWYWLYLNVQYNANFPFSVTIASYFSTQTIGSILGEMVLNLVALLVGFVATTIFLRRYATEGQQAPRTIYGAEYVRNTAILREHNSELVSLEELDLEAHE